VTHHFIYCVSKHVGQALVYETDAFALSDDADALASVLDDAAV
jgi:hypothetical protein